MPVFTVGGLSSPLQAPSPCPLPDVSCLVTNLNFLCIKILIVFFFLIYVFFCNIRPLVMIISAFHYVSHGTVRQLFFSFIFFRVLLFKMFHFIVTINFFSWRHSRNKNWVTTFLFCDRVCAYNLICSFSFRLYPFAEDAENVQFR